MGIVRYPIRCAGCGERINLRLTVGSDAEQPFYFPCPVCGAPTRGRLSYLCGAKTALSLESGDLLKEELVDVPTASISADIPSVWSAREMHEHGGSAFLHFSQLVGLDQMQRFVDTSEAARESARKYGPVLGRLISYFRAQDWQRFDANLETVLPSGAPLPTAEWQRADILHRMFDLLVVPVLALDTKQFYPDMKAEWNAIWSHRALYHDALKAYADREWNSPKLLACHRDLLSCLEGYVAKLPAILPRALCNMVPNDRQAYLEKLRLFRDDFEALRDLYVTSFEACHKALGWVIGAVNVGQRGSVDAFQALSNAKVPPSFKRFDRIVSAEKRRYLICLPEWDADWDQLLDRQLRNDFGHASARHDLTSGVVHRDQRPDLPYPRFLQRVHHLGHALLACANALKLIRIIGSH